jgi:ABC-2 type transport system ATP-binding protein
MLKAQQLSRSYGDHLALDKLDLEIKDGEILSLLGPNGAGKTTTIQLFLGFLQPSAGQAVVDGLVCHENPQAVRKSLAYIPEMVQLYPTLSGQENLVYFCELSGVRVTSAEAEHHLSAAGLESAHHDRRVGGYSKGMRQKVGIAIAAARGVNNYLFDEPTSGLDPGASHDFARLLRQLKDRGAAVLMATHDLFHVKQAATRVAILQQGILRCEHSLDGIGLEELQSLYNETR